MIFLWITLGVAVYLAVGAVLGRLLARWNYRVERMMGDSPEAARDGSRVCAWWVLFLWPGLGPLSLLAFSIFEVVQYVKRHRREDWHPIARMSAWLVRGIPEDTR